MDFVSLKDYLRQTKIATVPIYVSMTYICIPRIRAGVTGTKCTRCKNAGIKFVIITVFYFQRLSGMATQETTVGFTAQNLVGRITQRSLRATLGAMLMFVVLLHSFRLSNGQARLRTSS